LGGNVCTWWAPGRAEAVRSREIGWRGLILLIACTAVILAGCGSSSARKTPAAGNFAGLVSVGGGRKIYLQCRGTGTPTVVLVSGLDAAADVWSAYQARASNSVFARVARFTRVCAYDRPGTPVGDKLRPSRSTPVRQPTTAQDAATDLRVLLRDAGVSGPYVLVGHSYGGLITRLYAAEYPADVAGLVFVDAFAPQWKTSLTSRQWKVLKAITGPSVALRAQYPAIERINFDRSVAEARATRPPRCALPAEVISRNTRTPPGDLGPVIAAQVAQGKLPAFVPKNFGYIDDRAWDKAQAALTHMVPGARQIIVTSGHNIQIDRPQIVSTAIHQVVAKAWQRRTRVDLLPARCHAAA
jgi:pimeloyl-ACP methyl ester carboxylesterase